MRLTSNLCWATVGPARRYSIFVLPGKLPGQGKLPAESKCQPALLLRQPGRSNCLRFLIGIVWHNLVELYYHDIRNTSFFEATKEWDNF